MAASETVEPADPGGAREVDLPQGTIRYREAGTGTGEPIVFVHGFLVDGRLWDRVVDALGEDFRCIVPDLPLGAHRTALDPDADLSPPGVASLLAGFLDALGLERATLVGNDSGGAICQILAAERPERVERLVLTNCDAYENFLPPLFRYLQVAARVPGGIALLMQSMRIPAMRRTPIAFGWLTKRPIASQLLADWTRPILDDPAIRRDAVKLLRGISKHQTLAATERLRSFDRPVLLVWGVDDRSFKLSFAERLVADIPGARLERVEDATTFVPLDAPRRTAELIADFMGSERVTPAPSG